MYENVENKKPEKYKTIDWSEYNHEQEHFNQKH